MKNNTYVNNVRVVFVDNTHKPIIFSFHHLKTQEECIAAIYQYVNDKNKANYRKDKIQSIEFIDDYVTVISEDSKKK